MYAKELLVEIVKSESFTADLRCRAADFERLENLVDKVQQDKRKLGVRVNRLVQTGELKC